MPRRIHLVAGGLAFPRAHHMASPLSFLKTQLFVTPTYPTKSFASKTVIVTGANTGLGLEAARHFVRLGASTVILAVRTISKGEAAKASIEASERCSTDTVQVWQLDLASYDSVKAFAKQVETLPRVDAVVENAGIATWDFKLAEGHESTMTVNVISTFLLALLILPKLRETAARFNTRPYLVIVTSEVHHWTDMPERKSAEIFKALDDKDGANMSDRYNVSKLLEILVVREMLDSVIEDKDSYPVIINTVNPGMCHSELTKDLGWMLTITKLLLARKTEVGSRTLVNAAGEIGEKSQGEYLSDCAVSPPSPFVRSEEGRKTQKRVWDELTSILEEIEPGVTRNI